MAITPIETKYAGCKFRSRLEARWAVFFDTLGIKWQYEPQGYVVNGKPYLPDFRLPDLKAFVEVKGDATKLDFKVLTDLAEKSPRDTLFVLILGEIPAHEENTLPTHAMFSPVFDWRSGVGGELNGRPSMEVADQALTAMRSLEEPARSAVQKLFDHERRQTVVCQRVMFMPTDGGHLFPLGPANAFSSVEEILNPPLLRIFRTAPVVAAAYEAARSARFEHGESGAR
ncbi:hypothetical protein [Kitasatospora camelliae]|uniref:Restriction endonuclease n=1 Tax=Kitasatospora camelliae TaxID=3156397 RepID=A0AAU8K4I8_9ACTN